MHRYKNNEDAKKTITGIVKIFMKRTGLIGDIIDVKDVKFAAESAAESAILNINEHYALSADERINAAISSLWKRYNAIF